jgi:hypothetical protein
MWTKAPSFADAIVMRARKATGIDKVSELVEHSFDEFSTPASRSSSPDSFALFASRMTASINRCFVSEEMKGPASAKKGNFRPSMRLHEEPRALTAKADRWRWRRAELKTSRCCTTSLCIIEDRNDVLCEPTSRNPRSPDRCFGLHLQVMQP